MATRKPFASGSESDELRTCPEATMQRPKFDLQGGTGQKLELSSAVKAVLGRIETAQLTRVKENIAREMSDILSNVNRVIERYRDYSGLDFLTRKELSSFVTDRKKQKTFLIQKIGFVAQDMATKNEVLQDIYEWLVEWNIILSEETKEALGEDEQDWVEAMEKTLPLSLTATQGSVSSLSSFCSYLLAEHKRTKKKLITKGKLWKTWKEKALRRKSASAIQPLNPGQMVKDEKMLNKRVVEVQGMLQELVGSSMFNKTEVHAILYMSATVGNLTKALELQKREMASLQTQHATLEAEMAENHRIQILSFQQATKALLQNKGALEKQVQNMEEKYRQALRAKDAVRHQLPAAAIEAALSEDGEKWSKTKGSLKLHPGTPRGVEEEVEKKGRPRKATPRAPKRSDRGAEGGREAERPAEEELRPAFPEPPSDQRMGGIALPPASPPSDLKEAGAHPEEPGVSEGQGRGPRETRAGDEGDEKQPSLDTLSDKARVSEETEVTSSQAALSGEAETEPGSNVPSVRDEDESERPGASWDSDLGSRDWEDFEANLADFGYEVLAGPWRGPGPPGDTAPSSEGTREDSSVASFESLERPPKPRDPRGKGKKQKGAPPKAKAKPGKDQGSPAGLAELGVLTDFQQALMAFIQRKIEELGKAEELEKPGEQEGWTESGVLPRNPEARKLFEVTKSKMEEYFQKVMELLVAAMKQPQSGRQAGRAREKRGGTERIPPAQRGTGRLRKGPPGPSPGPPGADEMDPWVATVFRVLQRAAGRPADFPLPWEAEEGGKPDESQPRPPWREPRGPGGKPEIPGAKRGEKRPAGKALGRWQQQKGQLAQQAELGQREWGGLEPMKERAKEEDDDWKTEEEEEEEELKDEMILEEKEEEEEDYLSMRFLPQLAHSRLPSMLLSTSLTTQKQGVGRGLSRAGRLRRSSRPQLSQGSAAKPLRKLMLLNQKAHALLPSPTTKKGQGQSYLSLATSLGLQALSSATKSQAQAVPLPSDRLGKEPDSAVSEKPRVADIVALAKGPQKPELPLLSEQIQKMWRPYVAKPPREGAPALTADQRWAADFPALDGQVRGAIPPATTSDLPLALVGRVPKVQPQTSLPPVPTEPRISLPPVPVEPQTSLPLAPTQAQISFPTVPVDSRTSVPLVPTKPQTSLPPVSMEARTSLPPAPTGPRTSLPPAPTEPRTSLPLTPTGPRTSLPPAPTGLRTSLPPAPTGLQASLPPASMEPRTSLPPAPMGPRTSFPPAHPGPQTSLPPAPPGPQASLPPASIEPQISLPPAPTGPRTSLPPAPTGPQASLPLASMKPRTSLPPASMGPWTSLPPASIEPRTSLPPASTEPRTSLPPASTGLRTSLPPAPTGPRASLPLAPKEPRTSLPATVLTEPQTPLPPASMKPRTSLPAALVEAQTWLRPAPTEPRASVPPAPLDPQTSLPPAPMEQPQTWLPTGPPQPRTPLLPAPQASLPTAPSVPAAPTLWPWQVPSLAPADSRLVSPAPSRPPRAVAAPKKPWLLSLPGFPTPLRTADTPVITKHPQKLVASIPAGRPGPSPGPAHPGWPRPSDHPAPAGSSQEWVRAGPVRPPWGAVSPAAAKQPQKLVTLTPTLRRLQLAPPVTIKRPQTLVPPAPSDGSWTLADRVPPGQSQAPAIPVPTGPPQVSAPLVPSDKSWTLATPAPSDQSSTTAPQAPADTPGPGHLRASSSAAEKPKALPASPPDGTQYWVDVEAQRSNLVLLSQPRVNAELPRPAWVLANDLIVETLRTDEARLVHLCRKYIAYRTIQGVRQNLGCRIQILKDSGRGPEARTLYVFLERLDSYQKKVLQAWTSKQKTLEQARSQYLRKMVSLFHQLRREYDLNLHSPMPLVGRPEKKQPRARPSPSHRVTAPASRPSPAGPKAGRKESDHLPRFSVPRETGMESLLQQGLTTSRHLRAEEILEASDWSQLGGYPAIPKLLELDVHATLRKSMASIRERFKNLPQPRAKKK
ncbi:protein FAM186A [Tachyglossus aculeatus]|uniref:protein FAM186A n=1 Tax=Tachyglossus aculeatus TaxID=9261 RepID=UPI0018F50665|nr:protein FAM186A [Tachyglossus aculeatus]